jgi:hypothetical protein
MAIKTFTTGEVLTASDTNTYLANSGLVFVKSQTIGTGVTTVTVNDAFSATFKSYLIQFTDVNASASGVITFALNGLTTGYYGNLIYANHLSGAPSSAGYNNIANVTHAGGLNGSNAFLNMTVVNPFLAKTTLMTSDFIDTANAGRTQAYQSSNTSATGFNIGLTAGTITGGQVTVYGYRNG